MTDKELPPILEDHPIQEIWKINRLDTAGLIELAKSGDTDAAKDLMSRYVRMRKLVLKERALGCYLPAYPCETHVLLEEYILESIASSYRTGDANKGFNLKNKERNRPKSTYKEKLEHCRIGYRVAELRDILPSDSKARYIAAKELGIKDGTLRNYHDKYAKIKCK
jgi:hypothetical protein